MITQLSGTYIPADVVSKSGEMIGMHINSRTPHLKISFFFFISFVTMLCAFSLLRTCKSTRVELARRSSVDFKTICHAID